MSIGNEKKRREFEIEGRIIKEEGRKEMRG